MQVAAVAATEMGPAVLLTDGEKLVPIHVGEGEAFAIALRAERRRFERPLTVDLLDAMVAELGGRIVQVRIDALKSSTFVAQIGLQHRKKIAWLDARSSDAIAIALGAGLPIWVHPSV